MNVRSWCACTSSRMSLEADLRRHRPLAEDCYQRVLRTGSPDHNGWFSGGSTPATFGLVMPMAIAAPSQEGAGDQRSRRSPFEGRTIEVASRLLSAPRRTPSRWKVRRYAQC